MQLVVAKLYIVSNFSILQPQSTKQFCLCFMYLSILTEANLCSIIPDNQEAWQRPAPFSTWVLADHVKQEHNTNWVMPQPLKGTIPYTAFIHGIHHMHNHLQQWFLTREIFVRMSQGAIQY